jgi:hypothetical protein
MQSRVGRRVKAASKPCGTSNRDNWTKKNPKGTNIKKKEFVMTAHQATIGKDVTPRSNGSEKSHHDQDGLRKTIDAIHKYGAEQLRIQPPSDRLTKAQREISEFYRSQFEGKPSVSKAIKDLSLTKPKLGLRDARSLPLDSPVKVVPVAASPVIQTSEVRTAPYDDVWVWGNQGKHEKNINGVIGIWGSCGGVSQDGVPDQDEEHLNGATGILVRVTTDKPASVQAKATIFNSWQYLVAAHGPYSWAAIDGGIDMAAFFNGNPIDGPRRDTIFNDQVNWANEVSHTGSGVEHVVVNFFINPGDVVGVPFGVWLTCDHLSGVGSAGATGAMTAQVMSVEITKTFV